MTFQYIGQYAICSIMWCYSTGWCKAGKECSEFNGGCNQDDERSWRCLHEGGNITISINDYSRNLRWIKLPILCSFYFTGTLDNVDASVIAACFWCIEPSNQSQFKNDCIQVYQIFSAGFKLLRPMLIPICLLQNFSYILTISSVSNSNFFNSFLYCHMTILWQISPAIWIVTEQNVPIPIVTLHQLVQDRVMLNKWPKHSSHDNSSCSRNIWKGRYNFLLFVTLVNIYFLSY